MSRSSIDVQNHLRHYFNRASEPNLPVDFADNMRGHRPGNQSSHMYNTEAMPYWRQMPQSKLYYPAHSDYQILKNRRNRLSDYAAELNRRGDVTLVVMGAGDEYASEHKTWVLAEIFNAKTIVLVDYSQASLHATAFHLRQLAKKEGKEIEIILSRRDYNKENFDIPTEGPRVFEHLGVAFGNMEGPPNMSMGDTIRIIWSHLRKQMNEGDLALVSMDRNTDRASLLKAYKTPEFLGWVDRHRFYLEKNFGRVGYRAENYANNDHDLWDPKNLVLTFGTFARKTGILDLNQDNVMFDGQNHAPILVRNGQKNTFLNSFRFEQSMVDTHVKTVVGHTPRDQMRRDDVLEDDHGFIGIQALLATNEEPKAPAFV